MNMKNLGNESQHHFQKMKKTMAFALALLACGFWATSAVAIPNLQIYSPDPGVYYDMDTETWIIPSYNYNLWVIGAAREIADVKLGLAVPVGETGSITITDYNLSGDPVTTLTPDLLTPYPGPYDQSADNNNTDPYYVDFGTPLMGDGAAVPGGGVFPTSYYQYYIGDFSIGETVQNYMPGEEWGATGSGETKEFYISVSGYSWVDIIAYDHVVLGKNKAKYVFSPYSHDGSSGGDTPVPEPATMLLFGTGLTGFGWLARRKNRKH